MKKNNFWIATTLVLLVVLIAVCLPGDALAQGTTTQEALALFAQVFRFVENNYVDEIDPQLLLDGALKGLLDSLEDPHSAFLNNLALRDLDDTTSGKFGGVGMYISKPDNSEEEEEEGELYIEIIAPIEGTPSDRIGIRAGDIILEIEGDSTANMKIDEAVSALRGRPGSEVAILIRRANFTFPLRIKREIIEVPTIRSAIIPEHNIGYIRIIQFTPFTAERIIDTIQDFERDNYRSLIIDIRQNPGGLLSASVKVADIFLNEGLIVGTTGRNQRENQEFYATTGAAVADGIQMVVLIDKGSASASEIFAGALKDHGQALIVGETSYGKGSVQQIRRVGDGGIRLTMSRYYTPNGSYIDDRGIAPDIVVEDTDLTDQQIQDYTELLTSGAIENFVNNRTTIDQSEINSFVLDQQESSALTNRYLQKLVRDEVNRASNNRQVYDLEFDLALQRAVELLK